MQDIYIKAIAEKASCRSWQVENCIQLFEEGSTIPFISRYRKERTGGLDEVAIAEIRHWSEAYAELDKRKQLILKTIEEADALTPELRSRIENSVDAREVEDLYLPWRPKRRTRATAAKEAGLEPLALLIYEMRCQNPAAEAERFCGGEGQPGNVEVALAGARDIIAEKFSDSAAVRETLRGMMGSRRIVFKATKAGRENPQAQKYRSFFDGSELLSKVAPHRLLAMLRAEDEGFISLHIDQDAQKACNKIYYDFCKERRFPAPAVAEQLRAAIEDAYQRLLEPSVSNELIRSAKEKADIESIKIFGANLRQLLLAAPVGQKRLLAIDPGFRTGCKLVCLDAQGELLHHDVIYPHPPANEKVKAIQTLSSLIARYDVEVIAVGNGTAGRETEEFLKRVPKPEGCRVFSVSEDGASIYSASEVAREEFPQYDVTVRGAVSIGRRLMDPLAELVKIDPKSLGVGQYQHDVDQVLLRETLDNTVESCVNSVGVNLNTASPWLLRYVSGIGSVLAGNIVEYRTQNGPYSSREELLKVKRLGAKAYEQCAGFLRIPGAANPLDNSAVHPESYHIVDRMAADLGVDSATLVGNAELCSRIEAEKYVEGGFGLPTLNDIIRELAKPGRDPRAEAAEFAFAEDIHSIEDLRPGMELPGIVTNVTAFGAFVDIGIHEQGLIHVSNMGIPRGADPSSAVKLRQQLKVSVISVDTERNRIGLKLLR